jgi:hypothetical protein
VFKLLNVIKTVNFRSCFETFDISTNYRVSQFIRSIKANNANVTSLYKCAEIRCHCCTHGFCVHLNQPPQRTAWFESRPTTEGLLSQVTTPALRERNCRCASPVSLHGRRHHGNHRYIDPIPTTMLHHARITGICTFILDIK